MTLSKLPPENRGEIRAGPLRYHRAFYSTWSRRLKLLLKVTRLNTTGLDKVQKSIGCILAPNHLNWKDPFFVSAVVPRPVRFVATYRLFDPSLCLQMLDEHAVKLTSDASQLRRYHKINQRLARFAVKRVLFSGAIPSQLNGGEYSLLDSLKKQLNNKRLICLFPEGRVSSPNKLHRFKLGLSRFLYDEYAQNGYSIPVFPVGITGTNQPFWPGMKLGLHIGDPLFIRDYLGSKVSKTLRGFTDSLKEHIVDLMHL